MAIEKIYEEIKKLSPAERYKLKVMLDLEEISKEDVELSKQAAGAWADIDTDKLIKEIYENRQKSPRSMGAEW